MLALVLVVVVVLVGCSRRDTSDPARKPLGVATGTAPQERQTPGVAAPRATVEFWKWFAANAQSLLAETMPAAMAKINDQLEPGHPGIFVEVGKEGDRRDLVISADGNKDLFPLVQQVYAARPLVTGWNIVAFRQRSKGSYSIEMHGMKVDPGMMKFVAAREADKLSITIYAPNFTDTAEMKQAMYTLLDHTVGEYDMETRIGGIEFAAIEKAPPGATQLLELPALIDTTFRPEPAR